MYGKIESKTQSRTGKNMMHKNVVVFREHKRK